MHKIGGKRSYLQRVNNHYVKFKYKGMKIVGVTDYTNKAPLSISDGKNVFNVSSTPINNKRLFIKCAQNWRCTSAMCNNQYAKIEYKGLKPIGVKDY